MGRKLGGQEMNEQSLLTDNSLTVLIIMNYLNLHKKFFNSKDFI